MISDRLNSWREDVLHHRRILDTIARDRIVIKDVMIEFLQQFFDFDEIQFTNDFDKITMKWSYEHEPIIKPSALVDLGMDFIISHDYSETLGHGVIITIYPFGLPEEDVLIED